MKKFIKVLDAVIDTDWLISSILTKDSTCLKIRQSSDLTLEFHGTPDELKAAQDAIWNQVEEGVAESEDRLLDDLRDCRGLHGVEPIVMHTNMMERQADE